MIIERARYIHCVLGEYFILYSPLLVRLDSGVLTNIPQHSQILNEDVLHSDICMFPCTPSIGVSYV